jgi:hypothetical protein
MILTEGRDRSKAETGTTSVGTTPSDQRREYTIMPDFLRDASSFREFAFWFAHVAYAQEVPPGAEITVKVGGPSLRRQWFTICYQNGRTVREQTVNRDDLIDWERILAASAENRATIRDYDEE